MKIIEQINQLFYNLQNIQTVVGGKTLNMAIFALEKQISKKPRKEIWIEDKKAKEGIRMASDNDDLTNIYTINFYCPNCDSNEWLNKKHKFCRTCGQALDWSDTE